LLTARPTHTWKAPQYSGRLETEDDRPHKAVAKACGRRHFSRRDELAGVTLSELGDAKNYIDEV
jgi:hypothetical protein